VGAYVFVNLCGLAANGWHLITLFVWRYQAKLHAWRAARHERRRLQPSSGGSTITIVAATFSRSGGSGNRVAVSWAEDEAVSQLVKEVEEGGAMTENRGRRSRGEERSCGEAGVEQRRGERHTMMSAD